LAAQYEALFQNELADIKAREIKEQATMMMPYTRA
jgi:hypothetical protein